MCSIDSSPRSSWTVRTGPPHDDRRDLELPVWAGVLPFRLAADTPIAAEDLEDGVAVPDYVRSYSRPPAPVTAR